MILINHLSVVSSVELSLITPRYVCFRAQIFTSSLVCWFRQSILVLYLRISARSGVASTTMFATLWSYW